MKTLNEVMQLSPGRPVVRNIFNLAATIPANGRHLADLHFESIRIVLAWLIGGGKSPQRLPDSDFSGQSFHLEAPGQTIDCIAIPDQGIWTVRLVHPDAPFKGSPAVAGRSWSTDIALRRRSDGIEVGVKVICSSLPYALQDPPFSRPRVVVDLAARLGLSETLPIASEAWVIKTEVEMDHLVEVLVDKDRILPIVIVSGSPIGRLGEKAANYLIDPHLLAKRLQGYAHVVAMPQRLSFTLTDKLGKTWSVFQGAIRTYMPGLDFNVDLPHVHPLLLAETLLHFQHSDLDGKDAVLQFLFEKLAAHSANRRIEWGERLFIGDARTLSAELAREGAADDRDSIGRLQGEIEAWKAKATEAQVQADGYFSTADEYGLQVDYYKNENAILRTKIDVLQASLNAKVGDATVESVEIPSSYEEMPEWVSRNLAGSLVLHNRAVRGLKDAQYADVGLVYGALLLLANEYRGMRRGLTSVADFEAGLKKLGLKNEKSIARWRAGEEGDTYFVRFPTSYGPVQFLEWHLTKGVDREARNCLRIYFFWAEDIEQVVVGWLPSHLRTRVS